MYHTAYKARSPSVGTSCGEYRPNDQSRIICKEIVLTKPNVTTNFNNVDLTQLDLNNGTISCSNGKEKKISTFYDSAGNKKDEVRKENIFVWCESNRNVTASNNNLKFIHTCVV